MEHLYHSLCGGDFAGLARGGFPQKREHPCQKGSPHRLARRQSETHMSAFSTGGGGFFFLNQATCSTHHIFYSSDFRFCLCISSVTPSPAAPLSYTSPVISYIHFSLPVMFSFHFPTHTASRLRPTTDFFSFADAVDRFFLLLLSLLIRLLRSLFLLS